MTVSWGFNPFVGNLDGLQNIGNYNLIPENVVIVKSGIVEVEGEKYNSIANAIIYINTQVPSLVNRWGISVLDFTNSESFTIPDYAGVYSAKGYEGILDTQLTGDITVGAYSQLNSVYCTGQITVGSTDSGAPAIFFGVYIAGTIVCSAGTYFEPVNSLLQVSSALELNGQMQILNTVWISSNLNVNAGGVLIGYWDIFGGSIVNNGGTISANTYGPFYDNATSGLSAYRVGEAIDELESEKVPYTGATTTVNLGAQDLTTTGDLTGTTITGTTLTDGSATVTGGTITATTFTDGTASLTGGSLTALGVLGMTTVTNISDILDEDDMASDSDTALATQQSIKAYVDDESLWQLSGDDTIELKTSKDIEVKSDFKLFFD